jgi:hypothetical protein
MHTVGYPTLAARRCGSYRWLILGQTCRYSDTGLYASEEWRRVYHDLVRPALPLFAAVTRMRISRRIV